MSEAATAPETSEQAEAWLGSRRALGWRFGLERMLRLTALLGEPQRDFRAVHVVGTNGKSSVTALTAAILGHSGVKSGAYLSPHERLWSERILIGGRPIDPESFTAAVAEVARASPRLGGEPDDAVTQFEAATAVALVALSRAGVTAGVIEAGLGGRLDATNVLGAEVVVLASVGLDHTQWLGETEEQIAAEKLAVLGPGATLITGELEPPIAAMAAARARELGCRLIAVTGESSDPAIAPGANRAAGDPRRVPFLRRNLAVAVAAAGAILGRDPEPVAIDAAIGTAVLHGRAQLVEGDPPLIADVAHNPQGAAALAEALSVITGGRPVHACVAVLADKDAAGIAAALAPALDGVVCCEIPPEVVAASGRPLSESVPAGALAELFTAAGVGAVEVRPDPVAALARSADLARSAEGVALVAGSHYLLGYL